MILRRSSVVAFAALALAACATTPVQPPRQPADAFAIASAATPRFSAQRLSDDIKYLASDEMEGRFPGLVGERLTLAYLQAQYEAMGLEPGGRDGSWLQPVELVRFTPQRAPTAAWTGADGARHVLTSGTDITLRAGAADPVVAITGAPLVFVGYGISAPTWDDYGAADLTGKVAVVLRGQPDSMGADPNFYGSTTHKMQEALRRGAVGVITLQDQDNRWRRAVGGATWPQMTIKGAQDARFTGAINLATATAIGGPALEAALAKAKTGALGGAVDLGARLDVDIAETTEVIHSNNLLAKIPGTERPDEYVFYSAHWDHIGKARTPNAEGDDIFNGAWDNASGTAGLIEMARAFKAGPAPKRTVVFLHVTAEEQGLLGSEAYAADPVYPLARTAADINIDMLPFTPATRDVAVFGVGKSELEDILGRFAAVQGRVVTGDGYPEEGFYYRSDHFNFAAGGVPALMPWTGRDFVEGGIETGKPYYEGQMDRYYHKLTDEWRADYDFTAALQNLDLLYRLGLTVADSASWPAWKPTAEFNAIRDRTADQRR
ncbi:Bacterial leucyl aminopeptidase precursor [Brevundimonas sp. SH203]|uniref:M28 family peptidase n=1 Tax=Brevundimonas sp. SH203 TaxID=345167 RepID=UPI0009D46CBF|nr:M28 family peptidase [Brevundimonas sp. SH203]GAW42510.1 Bacterial leucyl aminopeptidase precursor [Brevundimonas sp. SH203]